VRVGVVGEGADTPRCVGDRGFREVDHVGEAQLRCIGGDTGQQIGTLCRVNG